MSVSLRYKSNEDDAAYLVNEAFLKVLNNIGKLDIKDCIIPWLKRVMVNTAIDDFRKNKKHLQTLHMTNSDFQNLSKFSENAHIEFESVEYFQAMLNQLPKATRIVFNLYAIDGYSHNEVAKMLTISPDTSKWHVKQARKRLRVIYKKSEENGE